jgi:PAS domain S-box-containing protein
VRDLPIPASRLARWGIGLAFAALATLLRLLLQPLVHDEIPYIAHIPGVVLAAWFGGLPAGLVATVGSLAAVDLFVIQSHYGADIPTLDHLGSLAVVAVVMLGLSWQMARWRSAERSLAASNTKLAASTHELNLHALILENAYDAIFIRDGAQRITYWNEGARRLYGWTSDEAVGRNAHELLKTDPEGLEAMQAAVAASGTWQGLLYHRDRDGRSVVADSRHVRTRGAFVLEINRDATARVAAQRALLASERQLTALMDAASESIWLFDRNGHAVKANTTAAGRFGLSVDDVIGKSWDQFLPPDVAAVRGAKFEEVYSSKRPVAFEDEWLGISFAHVFYPVLDMNGDMAAVAVFSRDISGQKRAEAALHEYTQRLEEANRSKDQFLAVVSHELRTPLNAVLGWSQMLSSESPPDALRKGLAAITRNARTQAQLVEDLLDMTQIMSGRLRLDRRRIDIRPLLQQSVDAVRTASAGRKLRFETRFDGDLKTMADPLRVQQVFWNLLSNAVKFTPDEGLIRLEAERVDSAVRARVIDTGVGITPEFLPHVFDRFAQADSSPTRAHGGVGLGLAIVRTLVDAHGGTIAATSPGPGQGAVFTVTLPAD